MHKQLLDNMRKQVMALALSSYISQAEYFEPRTLSAGLNYPSNLSGGNDANVAPIKESLHLLMLFERISKIETSFKEADLLRRLLAECNSADLAAYSEYVQNKLSYIVQHSNEEIFSLMIEKCMTIVMPNDMSLKLTLQRETERNEAQDICIVLLHFQIIMASLRRVVDDCSEYWPMRDYLVYERLGALVELMRHALLYVRDPSAGNVVGSFQSEKPAVGASCYQTRIARLDVRAQTATALTELEEIVCQSVATSVDAVADRYPLVGALLLAMVGVFDRSRELVSQRQTE